MLDLGFSKIAVIGVVALIVLGPERLPRVARIAGTLFGRAQRYIRDVKDEVTREMDLSEFKDMGKAVQSELSKVEANIRDNWQEAGDAFNDKSVVNTSTLEQPYGLRPYTTHRAVRNGRDSWRVKTGRVPLWYKQHNGLKSRITTEAARMARHRSYAAHTRKKKTSFFT